MISKLAVLFTASLVAFAASAAKKPNVLFLLADDLGYAELGSYGQEMIKTPVLDQLAKDGMRFTNFYAGSAVCSPSRAVLMTGKKSSTNTIRGNMGVFNDGQWDRVALRKDDVTLGEMMRSAGYQTAFIGKWHLEDPYDISTWAYNRGFDYAVQEQWDKERGNQHKFEGPMEFINGMQDEINYDWKEWQCHDEFRTQLAFDYLDTIKKEDKPFFLFMSYRAPHGHEKVIGNTELYKEMGWPAIERHHAAKVTLLDTQIGRLLKKLDELGELDNTLVLFTSDNGPHKEMGHNHEFFNSNGDLTGYKRDLYEGGIRVPCLAYWKGQIQPGTVSDFIGCGQDFMLTLAEVAGAEIPKEANGVSILPVLTGKLQPERPYVHWEFRKVGKQATNFRQAIRIGNLKGVRYGANAPVKLFNLENDISEKKDIAKNYPEVVDRIKKIFRDERTENEHFPYGNKK